MWNSSKKIKATTANFEAAANSTNTIQINLQFADGVHLNTDAPNKFSAKTTSASIVATPSQESNFNNTKINVQFDYDGKESGSIIVTVEAYVCTDDGMCMPKRYEFTFSVVPGTENGVTKTEKYVIRGESSAMNLF